MQAQRRITLFPRCVRTALVLLALLVAGRPGAQEITPPSDTPPEDELAVSDQVVEVDDTAEDEDIGARLQGILESTERFTDPAVRVENGVVFITGATRNEDYKEWARQLALRTKDVVAVVNNITVEQVPIWDFEPAFAEMRRMGRGFVQGLPMVVLAFCILLLTVVVGRMVMMGVRPLLDRRFDSTILRDVISKTVLVLIGIIGLYFFLRVSGLTSLALAILSGTGVFGLLIGFAFRDIAENFLASVLISIQKPFHVGDTIEVDGHTGIVQKVTTRGTVLMAFDGNYIQIANSTVYKNTIRNFTANPKLRLDFGVGVGYDVAISEAQSTIMAVLRGHAAVLDDPEPSVLVEALGSSTVNLRVYYWINAREHSVLKVGSATIRQTLAALKLAGISMPDEAREIVFPDGVPVVNLDRHERAEEVRQLERKTAATARREKETPATESEGDLGSEVAGLNAQARASHIPEEGDDLLREQEEPNAGKRGKS